MTITAQGLNEAIRDFKHVQADLSDDFLELLATNIRISQEGKKSDYEDGWSVANTHLNNMISKGQDFGTIVRRMINPAAAGGLLDPAITSNCINVDYGEFENVPGQRLCAFDGKYRLIDESYVDLRLIDCLKEHLVSDVDCVVEFGSGWGKNLSLLLMSSGRSDVEYIACEQSASGRRCFENLFSQVDGVEFSSYPFDFSVSDLDMVGERKHVLAYTCAAIEQVMFLPRSFMEGLLSLAEKVTIVFLEPIGWQRSMDHLNLVLSTVLDEYSGKSAPGTYKDNFTFKFRDEHFLDNASAWSIASKYNINLLNTLSSYIDEKKASLLDIKYDIYSINPLNPYSLVVLKKN